MSGAEAAPGLHEGGCYAVLEAGGACNCRRAVSAERWTTDYTREFETLREHMRRAGRIEAAALEALPGTLGAIVTRAGVPIGTVRVLVAMGAPPTVRQRGALEAAIAEVMPIGVAFELEIFLPEDA